MSLTGVLLVPSVVVMAALLARVLPMRWRLAPWAERNLPAALGAGTISALFSIWAWGSLDAPAVIHDEAASLLQAQIFGAGHWSMPAPPLPEFFQQFHVLVTPRLAPKYWPGHGILLVPGVLLGLPALMPVLLTGLAGGLIFVLGRRVADTAAAGIGFCIWLTAPRLVVWRSTYLSVVSATALWLLGALFLLRWWENGRRYDLNLLSMTIAALAITRPVTAAAFALPTILVVVLGLRRRKAWSQVNSALALGALVLLVVPLWSRSSTGHWLWPPYFAYKTVPLSVEHPEIASPTDDATHFVPPDFGAYSRRYRAFADQASPIPTVLAHRVGTSLIDLFGGAPWRLGLIPFAFVGFVAVDRRGRFALWWLLAIYALYLPFRHFAHWSVYYVEVLSILAVLAAAGICRVFGVLAREESGVVHAMAAATACIAMVASAVVRVPGEMRGPRHRRQIMARFHARLDAIPPAEKAVVFIRYAPQHNVDISFVQNSPDWNGARYWLVYDRGEANRQLMAVAGERRPYLFDEQTFRLLPLAADGVAVRAAPENIRH